MAAFTTLTTLTAYTVNPTLAVDAAGNLFGTENTATDGTVFEIAKTSTGYGTPTTVVDLGANSALTDGLTADAEGNLFASGRAANGQAALFEFVRNADGSYTPTILSYFYPTYTYAANAFGGLTADAAGNLFGTTASGGGPSETDPTIFEVTKTAGGYANAITIVASFSGAGEVVPNSKLTVDAAGDLFGAMLSGGSFGAGAVFEIPKTSTGYASTPTILASFGATGASGPEHPNGGLVLDAAGDLIGTTTTGTLYKIANSGGTYSGAPITLATFSISPTFTASPNSGLIADAAGDLFGTTRPAANFSGGSVFEIPKTATGYATAPVILGGPSLTTTGQTTGDLIVNSAGNLFGTTGNGANGPATVFELSDTGFQVAGEGVLGTLSINQQLELIYIAYFNRSADGGGLGFWFGQNQQAQNAGQAAALTNIANSFAPQPETVAIYGFLEPLVSGSPIDLTTPASQAGLTTFIGAVYQNLFDRAADSAGQSYWLGQITSGAVGLGAAALAIANGATGSDATEVLNKVAVALDFTTRTNTAGLGTTAPLATSFVDAARNVLSGVDGVALNDASVSAAEAATSAYIADPASGQSVALGLSAETTAPLTITEPNIVVDPGPGNATIQFLAGSGGDTLVLHANSMDQVFGFDPSTDVLDLHAMLTEADVDPAGDLTSLGKYVSVVDQGADALLRFDPTGHGGGSVVADLRGPGATVTNLGSLVAEGAVRIA